MDSAEWYRTKSQQLQAMARQASTKRGGRGRSVYLTQLAEQLERDANACDASAGNKPWQHVTD